MDLSASRRRSAILAVAALFVLSGCATGGSPLLDEETGPPPQTEQPSLGEPVGLAIAKGEALLNAREFAPAQVKFSRALATEPENYQAMLGLAEAQLGLRQLMDALAGFEAVMGSESLQPKRKRVKRGQASPSSIRLWSIASRTSGSAS